MHFNELTATAALSLIHQGLLHPRELVQSCLTRIAERDPMIRAWLFVEKEQSALEQMEAHAVRLPLRGIPFGVKDIIDVATCPTTYNSPLHADHIAAYDADCVRLLRLQGAVPLGKTDTEEFACAGRAAATRNPHNTEHTPGGSSAGTAAAVADCMVPIALGTQTAGSVIRPASYCGTFALKPSFGYVSRAGIKLASESLDTLGWFARCVEDLALVGEAFRIPGFKTPLPPTPPTNFGIGIVRTPSWCMAEPCAQNALQSAADYLSRAGFRMREVDFDVGFSELTAAQATIMQAEARPAFMAEHIEHGPRLHPDLAAFLADSHRISDEKLCQAHDLAASWRPRFDAMFDSDLDAILTLASPGEAPRGLEFSGDFVFNAAWTLLHVPCIALPGFTGSSGLPIGVQLVGARYSDWRLLQIAQNVASQLPLPRWPIN